MIRPCLSLIVVLVMPFIAPAQQVGESVVVIAKDAPLQVGSEVIDRAVWGNIFLVHETNGEWLAVSKGKPAWINARHVVALDKGIDSLTNAIRQSPRDASAYVARGMVRKELGDLDGALADIDQGLRLGRPSAAVLTARGDAWARKHDFAKAMTDFNEAIKLDGRFTAAYLERGNALSDQGRLDLALADYQRALEIDPKSAYAYSNRGNVLSEQGKYREALADYRRAVELDPHFPPALNNLAWLLATCPDSSIRDGKMAVESATRACQLTAWNDPDWLDTLAAASAEAGDFDAAVKHAERALAFESPSEKKPMEERLALYREKKPFHEPAKPK